MIVLMGTEDSYLSRDVVEAKIAEERFHSRQDTDARSLLTPTVAKTRGNGIHLDKYGIDGAGAGEELGDHSLHKMDRMRSEFEVGLFMKVHLCSINSGT